MLLVGLTGGLGSGKSTVARMLAARGGVVVDADALAREAVGPQSAGLRQVVDAFGSSVLDEEGSLDRARLAQIVFQDEEARRRLEAIVHPEVFRLLAQTTERHRGSNDVVVFDAPLIVETGFDRACDLLVVVAAPREIRLARVMSDRGMGSEEAGRRIAAQADEEQRTARADLVIRNEGSLAELESRVDQVWEELKRRAIEEPGP